VLCPAVAVRQAEEAATNGQVGYTAVAELDMLTVHGILHLLGYDHAEPDEHREMFALQARLLAEWQGEPGAPPPAHEGPAPE
jgi:probable rRNA maturation factor